MNWWKSKMEEVDIKKGKKNPKHFSDITVEGGLGLE